MNLRKTILTASFLIICGSYAQSSELSFKFKNPSFSGVGYSNHVFAIEQVEDLRRQRNKEEQEKLKKEIESKLEQSNLQKFIRNVEARIYAQISKDIVDKMFESDGTSAGSINLGNSTVSFQNDGLSIVLNILDDKGGLTTITIPLGTF